MIFLAQLPGNYSYIERRWAMKRYKMVRITGIPYISAVEPWIKSNSDFENNTYNEMMGLFSGNNSLCYNGFSRIFKELGQDVYEIIADVEIVQKQWAKENNVRYEYDNWLIAILMAQINIIKPDLIYFQGTEWTIPGRYFPERKNDNLIKILKEKFPFIKKIIGVQNNLESKKIHPSPIRI